MAEVLILWSLHPQWAHYLWRRSVCIKWVKITCNWIQWFSYLKKGVLLLFFLNWWYTNIFIYQTYLFVHFPNTYAVQTMTIIFSNAVSLFLSELWSNTTLTHFVVNFHFSHVLQSVRMTFADRAEHLTHKVCTFLSLTDGQSLDESLNDWYIREREA